MRSMMRCAWLIALGVLVGCGHPPESPAELRAGLTRDEVRQIAGEPDRRDELIKTAEPIWGAVEAVWDELEPGERIEIWFYTRGGQVTELYFLRSEETVHSVARYAEGTVF